MGIWEGVLWEKHVGSHSSSSGFLAMAFHGRRFEGDTFCNYFLNGNTVGSNAVLSERVLFLPEFRVFQWYGGFSAVFHGSLCSSGPRGHCGGAYDDEKGSQIALEWRQFCASSGEGYIVPRVYHYICRFRRLDWETCRIRSDPYYYEIALDWNVHVLC